MIEKQQYGEAMQILTHIYPHRSQRYVCSWTKKAVAERWGWEQSTPVGVTGRHSQVQQSFAEEIRWCTVGLNFFGDASKFVGATDDVMSLVSSSPYVPSS
ncbi:hypothetical protein OH492_13370 [Vibrio chagasii]|nr:hypothetical protein [Vibrio chagasii]